MVNGIVLPIKKVFALVDSKISVEIKDEGRKLQGRLVAVDEYLNIHMDETIEFIDNQRGRSLGTVVIRGNNILTIAPVIGTEGGSSVAADPVDEGLKLIQSRPEGVLQSDLWKELGVDSRKCSRIVKKLEESGLIERLEFKKDGIKTYLLRSRQQPVNPSELLAGDELIPCIGCELECVVEECHPLMDWMYQLAIVEHTEE